jgi:hypothetical protein
MENKDRSVLIMGAIVSLFGVLVSLMYFNDKPTPVVTTNICKEDSLQNKIVELQMDLKLLSDGFDAKEKRYEEIIFEFGYGVDHLKIYEPQAYRVFHRILAHKEYFNRQDEQDNIKRLEIPKW